MNQSKRIEWIDNLKGILIILVVLGHVISSYNGAGITNRFCEIVFSIIYSFHMAAFIFISGYLFKTSDNIKQNIMKKISSYGIPYIIFSFIWIMFKLIFSKYVNTTVDITDFFKILIFPISFMWFIYALLLMNILQVAIQEKIDKKILLLISFIFLLIKPIIIKYYPNFSKLIICDFMGFWFYFILGHYYGNKIIPFASKKIIYIISLIIFILLNYVLIVLPSDFNFLQIFITSISGTIVTIGLAKKIDKFRLLQYIGRHTMSIYVLSSIIIAATRIIVNHISFFNTLFIKVTICTIMGMVIPLLIEFFCSKIWKLDFIFYPNKYIFSNRKE